ncbi:MAG: DUF6445 family protein [Casimicrobium sp.]
MFSDHLKITSTEVLPNVHAFVIDNALADPDALVQFAVKTKAAFRRSQTLSSPGVELRMADAFTAKLEEFFRQHLKGFFDARRILNSSTRLSMATLAPHELRAAQWLPLRSDYGVSTEQTVVNMKLHLFHDETLGGTGFYAPRISREQATRLARDSATLSEDEFAARYNVARGYCTENNAYFQLTKVIPPRFNRLIVYDGAMFHAAHIAAPEKLSNDPSTARLTLDGFIVCRRNASGLANRWAS